jgi:formate hydrogenlyase subunit 6/NADH:ubiquinone oxidoreductase subunit I
LKLDNAGMGMVRGLTVTLKNLFRRPITTQYPEQRLTPAKRTRGNMLVWNPEKCLVCSTCGKACPQGALKLVITSDPQNPNKSVMSKIEVDTGYCIFCGLCVEACPYNALFMSYAYELAKYRRRDLVQADLKLLATPENRASAFMHAENEAALPVQSLLVEKKTSLR